MEVFLIKASTVGLMWRLPTVQVEVKLEDMIVKKFDQKFKMKLILKIIPVLVKVARMN